MTRMKVIEAKGFEHFTNNIIRLEEQDDSQNHIAEYSRVRRNIPLIAPFQKMVSDSQFHNTVELCFVLS